MTKPSQPERRRRKAKQPNRLINHRSIAAMMDIEPRTITGWVSIGMFPEPHSIIKRTWFYDAAMIEHYIKTGRWSDHARFRSAPLRQEEDLSPATTDA